MTRPVLSMLVALAATVGLSLAQDADNTTKNKRDRAQSAVTAGEQGNSREDIALTRRIRKDILADKSLSINARNIKVIVRDGKVTLRGPVASEAEKSAIQAIAVRHAATGMVDDQLEIAAPAK